MWFSKKISKKKKTKYTQIRDDVKKRVHNRFSGMRDLANVECGIRASEGRVIRESEHQKRRAIPLCELFKGWVTHLFQKFFNEDFCLLLSIFLTDFKLKSFFLFQLLIRFLRVYCTMAYSFLRGLVSFSVHIEAYLTEVSSLQLLASGDHPLPDLLSH